MQRTQPNSEQKTQLERIKKTAVAYGRGIAGGLLIGMPLLMTMEMWWLGFYMDPWVMVTFLLVHMLVLFILEYYGGFQDESSLGRVAQDALIAYGLATLVSAVMLFTFHVLRPDMSLQEIIGKIVLVAVPVSIGVSVASSQFGQKNKENERRKRQAGFWGRQLIGLGGAFLFGFNVAPTEEMIMIGAKLNWWHALLLLAISFVMMHAIVVGLDFKGERQLKKGESFLGTLFQEGTFSYLVALLVAAFLLWAFDRINPGTGLAASLHMIITLGFPTSLGAAAARLLI